MSSNSFTRAIKTLWEKKETQADKQNGSGHNIQGQIDDVFLVLALMGEALLPLDIFDDAHYDSTLQDVRFAMANCGNVVLEDIFDKMSGEIKYLCVAALTVCAVFSPLHVYRGFGASVHGDWDWGCPDFDYLESKAKKSTGVFSKTPDPQPNRPTLLAFDRMIRLLQMKSIAFLSRRPLVSGIQEQQPRYTTRSRNDVLGLLHTCREWKRYIHKNGHPTPPGTTVTTWSMPWAGWTSAFNCETTRDFEQILLNQMDPGRILHAFLCRDILTLQEGHMLALPPLSPAEVLACWLADCPGHAHKIIEWEEIDSSKEGRLRLLDKKVMKKMGRYPLPSRFAVRGAKATSLPRPRSRAAPAFVYTEAAPAYSLGNMNVVSELGTSEPVELDSTPRTKSDKEDLPDQTASPRPHQSEFVTKTNEMPLNSMAILNRDLPPIPSEKTIPSPQLDKSSEFQQVEHTAEMQDTSIIPSPLRLRNPRSFAAELPAEPFEASVTRSATIASTISSSEATPSSFSPVSPLTPMTAGNFAYVAMPAQGPLAARTQPDRNTVQSQAAQQSPESEAQHNEQYLDYGRAASG